MTKSKRTSGSMLKNNDLVVLIRKKRLDRRAHQKRVNRTKALKNERRKES